MYNGLEENLWIVKQEFGTFSRFLVVFRRKACSHEIILQGYRSHIYMENFIIKYFVLKKTIKIFIKKFYYTLAYLY